MIKPFILLLASVLIPTLLFYFVGALFLKRLKVTGIVIGIGFFAAWLLTGIVAILLADQPNGESAQSVSVVAALISSIITLAVVVVAGKRK